MERAAAQVRQALETGGPVAAAAALQAEAEALGSPERPLGAFKDGPARDAFMKDLFERLVQSRFDEQLRPTVR